jgi:hypothetical protein
MRIEIVCRLPFEAVLIFSYLMMYMPGFLAHIDTVEQRMYSRFTKRDLVKLNPEKTEIIKVSKALQTHPKKYILGGQEIYRVQSIKHLGITYRMYSRFSVELLGTFLIFACSPRPSRAYIVRLPILNLSSIFIFPFSW